MNRTITINLACAILMLPAIFGGSVLPPASHAAAPASPTHLERTRVLQAGQQGQTQINASSSQFVVSAATYGTVIVFKQISGLPPLSGVANNSTAITDSAGSRIGCLNQAYNVTANGAVYNLTVKMLGNASSGPFGLEGIVGGTLFAVQYAGISSEPSGVDSALFLSPSIQSSGGTVTLYGADFVAGQEVGYPIVGNQSYSTAAIQVADANGAFVKTFTLNALPAGVYQVRMSGAIQTSTTLVVTPHLLISPSYGHVGEKVVAQLSGFNPGLRVNLTWGSGETLSAIASSQGKAILVTDVPALPYGHHFLYANSSGVNTSSYFFLNSSCIALSTYGASPGSQLLAYAQGFRAGAAVGLNFNGRHLKQTANASVNGTALIHFSIPEMTAGGYQLQAISSDGMTSNVTTLMVKPTVSSSQMSVFVGSRVQIYGRFYYPSSSVKIYVGNDLIPQIFRSGLDGTLYANITIPVVPGGGETLGAFDAQGNNATVLTLKILPSLAVSSMSVTQGGDFRLTGAGFESGEHIVVLWNGLQLQYSANVTGDGTFSAIVTAPHVAPGTYIVSVENSTAQGVVVTVTQYTGFLQLLPAIILPLLTFVAGSLYLFSRFRIGKQGR